MLKKEPKIFIVIINWNGLKDTIECLNSLQKTSYKNKTIIVVDNGSLNNEADKIKKEFKDTLTIKLDKNTGFTGGCNTGMKYAIQNGADYVMLLNNDTCVSKNFLEPLLEGLQKDKSIGMVSPKILYHKSNKIWCMGGKISTSTGISIMIGKNDLSSKYSNNIIPDFLTGCAILISKQNLEKIGYFDNQYFAYYEDVDWSYRCKKLGYKIKVITKSIIWHKKSSSASTKGSNKISPMQAFLWARNGIIFGRRNLSGTKKIIFLINQFTFKFLFFLTRFQEPKAFSQYLKGLYYGINNKELQF